MPGAQLGELEVELSGQLCRERAREPLLQVAWSPDAVAASGANQAVGTGRDDQLQDAFANGARKSAWPPFAASALISKSILGHADLRRHR